MGERFRQRVEVYSAALDFFERKSEHFAPRGDLYMEAISPKAFRTPRGPPLRQDFHGSVSHSPASDRGESTSDR